MKNKNRFLLILLVGCMVVPTALGVCDSIFYEGPQPESVVEKSKYKIFVKFGNIVGESVQVNHKGWCESVAFEHEVVLEKGTQEPQSLIKSTMKPFEITKLMDRASPKLNEAALKGKIFSLITIDLVHQEENGFLFMQYIFKNAVVTSVFTSGDIGQTLPMERIQFYSEEMTWKYIPILYDGKPGATVEFSWKFETKEPVDVGLNDFNPQENPIIENQIDISGKWLSSVGSVLIIKQQGNQFSWTIEGLNKPATGQINGKELNATWKDRTGIKSAKGEITQVDSKGRATFIQWDNNITFNRD